MGFKGKMGIVLLPCSFTKRLLIKAKMVVLRNATNCHKMTNFFAKRYTKCYTFEISEFNLSESADEPGFLSIG